MSSEQPETREVEFAIPPSINSDVIGIDTRTNTNFLEVHNNVDIDRMILVNIPSNTTFEIDIVKDGYPQRTIYSELMGQNLPGPIYPGFPIGLGPGMKQLFLRQMSGTITTKKPGVLLVFNGPM